VPPTKQTRTRTRDVSHNAASLRIPHENSALGLSIHPHDYKACGPADPPGAASPEEPLKFINQLIYFFFLLESFELSGLLFLTGVTSGRVICMQVGVLQWPPRIVRRSSVTRGLALRGCGLASNCMPRKASSELYLLHSIFPQGTFGRARLYKLRRCVTHGVKIFVN
jgi:hypothetical protein